MLQVFIRYQEKVNSLWITSNPYSMIYTLPWVTPDTPVTSVSVTAINSTNWDKRESSTWVYEQLCEGWHLRLDHNQSRTTPGITVAYFVWCWLILHKFNSSEYLVVSELWVPRDSDKSACTVRKSLSKPSSRKNTFLPWLFPGLVAELLMRTQAYCT